MANEKDIEHKVEIYLLGYFQDLKKVIKFQEDQFKEYKIELDSHIDYTKLFPFIKTAIDSVAKNDKTITVGIFKSLYQETQDFVNLYNQFVKEHHGKTKQLNQKMITELLEENIVTQNDISSEQFQKIIYAKFKKHFEIQYKEVLQRFQKIVKMKCYYTDKVFWSNARRSPLIQDFFDKMGIEGKINLKSYMAYYLKRIKISNMKDPTWNEFLKQTLVML
jgi:hypothetical protein